MNDATRTPPAARYAMIVGLFAWSCAEILGLETPHPRPTADGENGGTSGGASGGASGTEAGQAGASDAGKAGTAGGGGASGGGGGSGNQGGAGASGSGTGGSSGDCAVGDRRCGGEMSTTPEVCDDGGNWIVNDSENDGDDCPILCEDGACRECGDGDRRCDGKEPQRCDDGAWVDETVCEHYCRNAECENPRSCRSLAAGCGSSPSCCSAFEVPGGTFTRDFDDVDYTNDNYHATLSSFLLDEFEVTVGRLRSFVAAYPSLQLIEGDGKAEHIDADTGWHETYPLPATVEALKAQLACTGSTWTDEPIGREQLPANCVNFFVAYAFCIWDGGRLPTEAEWNRAAAGGNQQRVYPWSDPAGSTAITPDHAAFDLADPLPPAVGLKPLGKGLWLHADLAGSLDEWTLDGYVEPYESTQCDDCLVTTGLVVNGLGYRSLRGGSFEDPEDHLYVARRRPQEESGPQNYVGFRCVRDIETQPIN